MKIETTYILTAEGNKILQNKKTGALTPSVWLKVNEDKDDWEEIDPPVPEDEPEEPEEEDES